MAGSQKKGKRKDGGKIEEEDVPVVPKDDDGNAPPHDCSDCTVDAMSEVRDGGPPNRIQADRDTQYAVSRVAESTGAVSLTAHPSNPACPCVFGDRINVEFIRIHTGLANQTRRQLLRMPQLIQVEDTGIDSNPNLISVNNCTITVQVSQINDALRSGSMSGVQFNLKAVPLRIAGRVRCNSKWRKFVVEFTDD